MKRQIIARAAMAIGLAGILLLNPVMALASTTPDSPAVARTKAWDGINHTLGGLPESVRKIELQGSVFYLAPDVTDDDFMTVLAAGPEAVRLKPPVAANVSRLYFYPVYILWNGDKTVLLVHPIIFDYDDILEAVAIQTPPPASHTGTASVTPQRAMTAQEATEYMLSAEYADAVRTEFYRLLNGHRKANGLRELEVNLELQAYADIRADEQRERFGHTRPNGSAAGSGWHNASNYLNTRYAENALRTGAIGQDPIDTALGIFTIWKESAGHNRHFLYRFDSHITMGFGIAPRVDDNGFVVSGAVFATGY